MTFSPTLTLTGDAQEGDHLRSKHGLYLGIGYFGILFLVMGSSVSAASRRADIGYGIIV